MRWWRAKGQLQGLMCPRRCPRFNLEGVELNNYRIKAARNFKMNMKAIKTQEGTKQLNESPQLKNRKTKDQAYRSLRQKESL